MTVKESLPSWERGLKLSNRRRINPLRYVAPFVGAWIETMGIALNTMSGSSLPSWERGLKPTGSRRMIWKELSLPSWERGLKLPVLW